MVKSMKKAVAFILTAAFLISYCMPATAAWDGYGEKDADSDVITIVDANKLSSIFASNGVPSTKIKGDGQRFSIYWADMVNTKSIIFNSVPKNWNAYDTISFRIYSKKATGTDFMFTVFCEWEPNAGTTVSYFSRRITLDWEGWKDFELSLKSDFTKGNVTDYSKVQYVRLTTDGWNCVPSKDASLYIDSIYLKKGESENAVVDSGNYTGKEKDTFVKTMGDSMSIYEWNRNVYHNGKVTSIDPENPLLKTVNYKGVSAVPINFFKNSLGCEITEGNGGYTLKKGDKTLFLKEGDASSVNPAPFTQDDVLYVPVSEAAQKLGIKTQSFDAMTVFGESADYAALESDSRLREVGEYITCSKQQTEVKAEDFDAVKKAWRTYLVGDENNNTKDSVVAKVIANTEREAQSAWSMMNADKNREVLFGKNKITATADMTQQYKYLAQMAMGYGTYGSELYHNKKLKKDILTGLEWLYENYYGQAEIERKGWRDTSLYNWWDWCVGTPIELARVLLILQPELSQETVDKYLAPYDYLSKTLMMADDIQTIASRTEAGTLIAVLENDEEKLSNLLDSIAKVVTQNGMEPHTDGVKDDWNYVQHKEFPYAGGYGVSIVMERMVLVWSLLADSKLEISSPAVYNIANMLYYTFEPILYNGGTMSAFMGRRGGAEESSEGASFLAKALNVIGKFSEEDDTRIKHMIKRHATDENLPYIIKNMSVGEAQILSGILADDTVFANDDYENLQIYSSGDRLTWQKDGYAIALAMSSSRVGNYESINKNNMRGWYTGDGAVYLYTQKDKSQYGDTYWNNANLFHVAGTTEDTQERKAESIKNPWHSSKDFVGAAQLDEKYAAAAMDFEAYHRETPEDVVDDGYGGPQPVHKSTLTAKKSYFIFDDEMVCLGSDVTANDGFNVHTVIDNRRLTQTYFGESAAGEYKIKSVSATGNDGNVEENVLDNDLSTRWSLEGADGCYLTLELEEPSPVGYAGIAVFNGNASKLIFDIEVSTDGENWTTAYSGESSGTTTRMEAYDLGGVTAKYIRLSGHGRSSGSLWNSVTEMKVYAPRADGTMKTAFSADEETIYGAENIFVNGELLPKQNSYEQAKENTSWISLEGVGGWYFPNKETVSLKKTGNESAFLESWIDHGVNPQAKGYSYVILPNKTEAQTALYAQNPQIEILANDSKIQAVKEKNTNVTGMVFWEKGSFSNMSVSEPMICMQKDNGTELELSLCDPTHKVGKAEIIITENLTALSADDNIKVSAISGGTKIEVDFSAMSGRTLSVTLKK